jgi:hypothetical protein
MSHGGITITSGVEEMSLHNSRRSSHGGIFIISGMEKNPLSNFIKDILAQKFQLHLMALESLPPQMFVRLEIKKYINTLYLPLA